MSSNIFLLSLETNTTKGLCLTIPNQCLFTFGGVCKEYLAPDDHVTSALYKTYLCNKKFDSSARIELRTLHAREEPRLHDLQDVVNERIADAYHKQCQSSVL